MCLSYFCVHVKEYLSSAKGRKVCFGSQCLGSVHCGRKGIVGRYASHHGPDGSIEGELPVFTQLPLSPPLFCLGHGMVRMCRAGPRSVTVLWKHLIATPCMYHTNPQVILN